MRLVLTICFAGFATQVSAKRPPAGLSPKALERIHLILVGELVDHRLGDSLALQGRLIRVESDGDGTISLADFLSNADHFFLRLDHDGDQAADSDETRTYGQPDPRTERLPSRQLAGTEKADLIPIISNDEFILTGRSPAIARDGS